MLLSFLFFLYNIRLSPAAAFIFALPYSLWDKIRDTATSKTVFLTLRLMCSLAVAMLLGRIFSSLELQQNMVFVYFYLICDTLIFWHYYFAASPYKEKTEQRT